MTRQGRNFSEKRLSGCQLKAYIDDNIERRSLGMSYKPREDCEPIYCKFASEGSRPDDPVCEVVRRPIAHLEICPERNQGGSVDSPPVDTGQQSLLEGAAWSKTQSR
jgi:hypothetical protein